MWYALQAHMVLFRVLCVVVTWLRSHWWFRCLVLFVQLLALRASSRFKHDMGVFSRLNVETLERAPTSFLWQTCEVLRPWALFCKTTVNWNLLVLPHKMCTGTSENYVALRIVCLCHRKKKDRVSLFTEIVWIHNIRLVCALWVGPTLGVHCACLCICLVVCYQLLQRYLANISWHPCASVSEGLLSVVKAWVRLFERH